MSVYLLSNFKLKYGATRRDGRAITSYEQFEQSMERFVPALTAQGWNLVVALRSRTGTIFKVTHVWEVPDADAAGAGMRAMAADPSLLDELADRLSEVVEIETVELMSPMAYHPGST